MRPVDSLDKNGIREYQSSKGANIFKIPVNVFPGLWGNVYLVIVNNWQGSSYRVLIDSGSGFGESNQHIEQGLESISRIVNKNINFSNLTHVLITHGHIDHFGGLAYVRPKTKASIGVHELDLRTLTKYEERLVVVSHRLEQFLQEAGVEEELRQTLIELYKVTKSIFSSIKVDFTFQKAGMQIGPFSMLHVPGHCSGHVVIRIDDVLFSGDHVLKETSPHQVPEYLTMFTGLDHYLQSLENLDAWCNGINLTLGGHEAEIFKLHERLGEIHDLHQNRLEQVMVILEKPSTIKEVSHELFGQVHGYNILLALEEAGAHIEYLYQRGLLEIHNISSFDKNNGKVPLEYHRIN